MISTTVKLALANVVYHSGLLSGIEHLRARSTQSGLCIILMYHRVRPMDKESAGRSDWLRYQSLPGIVVSPAMFEAQMEYLSENYRVISLEQMLQSFETDHAPPKRSVVITFDDGWRDNYVYAFPILRKLNLPATIFLSAGYVGTHRIFWPEQVISCLSERRGFVQDRLAGAPASVPSELRRLIKMICESVSENHVHLLDRLIAQMKRLAPAARESLMRSLFDCAPGPEDSILDDRVMLDWNEVVEMKAAGITFGSHAVNHELLTLLEPGLQTRELFESKAIIESRLGCPVDTLAYPNGNHDDDLIRLVRDAGYRCAVTVVSAHVSRRSNRYKLGRVNVHQGNSSGIFGRFSKALFAFHIQRVMG
jgi:peptidoglycan/xylan/chitin deacetylase (PgdA/CDA1 family)